MRGSIAMSVSFVSRLAGSQGGKGGKVDNQHRNFYRGYRHYLGDLFPGGYYRGVDLPVGLLSKCLNDFVHRAGYNMSTPLIYG